MPASGVDLYEILEVSRDASGEEIKKSYRRLARKFHPDVNGNADAADKFKEVKLAYEVLSDPQRRTRYDQFGTTNERGGMGGGDPYGGQGFGNINDIFDFFFGGGGFSGGGSSARRRDYRPGEDIHKAVHLNLTDVLEDQDREIKVERREACSTCEGSGAEPGTEPEVCQTCGGQGAVIQIRDTILGRMQTTTSCPNCQGKGRIVRNPCGKCRGSGLEEKSRTVEVTVPAGVDDGNVLRVGSQGHSGRGGAPNGDLLLAISIEPDRRFERGGADLSCELPIHYADLVLGTTAKVETLTGEEDLRIPAGTQSHEIFILRGHGLPRLRGSGRGSLHVKVKVAVPDRIGRKQKELLSELREADVAESKSGGFFKKLFGLK